MRTFGLLLVAFVLVVGVGCSSDSKDKRAPAAAVAPPPNFTGPDFLKGSVGSMVSLRPGTAEPQLVSGIGLVVFPPGTGTGSSEVPAMYRQRVITNMRKQGVGSARTRAHMPPQLQPFMSMTPEQLLDTGDVAVVEVRGLVPPGATKQTRFDVLVTALGTQTTSLSGGTLWTTELSVQGSNPNIEFSHTLAEAYGPIFINPISDDPIGERAEFQKTGVVVLGGTATAARPIELVLNQPSWTRSRLIADRINERFGRATDAKPVAQPQTDVRIRLNVPERWSHQPDVLLDLVGHLFVERGLGYEEVKAAALGTTLEDKPNTEKNVVSAWKALGRNAVPTLRGYYTPDKPMRLRLAALEAGAWLNDSSAARHLDEIANDSDPAVRIRAAAALVHLPSSLQGAATLRRLLDDSDVKVRLSAYESLARINDTAILDRLAIGNGEDIKFLIDRVPAQKPLLYVTQEAMPRIVIFGDNLGFKTPMLARLWDSHLMLKAPAADQPMSIFFQQPTQPKPKTHQVYPHNVATLAYVLGHHPNQRDLQDGLDLTYAHVVDVLYQLTKEGWIEAPMEFRLSELAQKVDELQKKPTYRPETGTNEQGIDDSLENPKGATPAGEPEAPPADANLSQRPEMDSEAGVGAATP